jgi:DNA-binding beta-propeller fold protein YncE
VRVITRTIGLLLLVGLAAACGTTVHPSPPAQRQASAEPLVWPQPPQQPLIRFIRTVARPADLGIRPSFWKRLLQVVRGQDEEWFVRPGGVTTQGMRVYVADPGARALWILDSQAGRFQRIQKAGEQRLVSPVAVAPGQKSRVYLADSYLAKVFIYSVHGELLETIAEVNLQRPAGLAYDTETDRLYVADSAAHRVWMFTGGGQAIGAIGQRGRGAGEFNFPTHLAVDREGTLYVTDAMGFRIQMFARDGRYLGAFGHHGDGSGDFAAPKGVGVDSQGHVYVVDALFDTVQIFDRRGQYLMNFGHRGIGLGQFWLPGGLFIDGKDRIYVADAYNQRIQIFEYLPGGNDG